MDFQSVDYSGIRQLNFWRIRTGSQAFKRLEYPSFPEISMQQAIRDNARKAGRFRWEAKGDRQATLDAEFQDDAALSLPKRDGPDGADSAMAFGQRKGLRIKTPFFGNQHHIGFVWKAVAVVRD